MEKSIYIRATFIITSLILLIKVVQLQIFDNTSKTIAQATALSKQIQYPSRGLIYDRNEDLLVYNEAIYDILVVYNNIDPKMDTSLFCTLLDIDRETFNANLNKDWRSPRFSKNVEFVFLSKVSPQKHARFQEHLFEFPGFKARLRNVRGYRYDAAAHVLGYINEADQDFLDNNQGYQSGDFVGVFGLEKTYEKELRGKKGHKYLLKDNIGREVGTYENGRLDSMAIPGYDLITTLDIDLQLYAETLMENKRGGIVAIEPATGEILCMLSSPNWNPNELTIHKDRTKIFNQLSSDTLKPFFDRTVSATYPPGSIFKMVVGLVALEEEITHPNRFISCNGLYFNTASDVRKCRDHPLPYNMSIGIQYSCNSYFFQLFKEVVDKYGYDKAELGLDNFHNYLRNFGFGSTLSQDHSYEEAGLIPDSKYYEKNHPNLRSPNIVSLGIGQGELSMTNLQMANLGVIIANRGYFITPHLLKRMKGENAAQIEKPQIKRSVRISEHHFVPIVNGMESVVSMGTGKLARVPGIEVAGKTGTVQNPHGEDHSVFVAFAPVDNPQISLVVYVENSGGGSRYAAPIAGLMIEKYLNKSISEGKKQLEENMIKTVLVPIDPIP